MQGKDVFVVLEGKARGTANALRKLFDQYDANRSGKLDLSELGHMLHDLVPSISEPEAKYFQVCAHTWYMQSTIY